MKLTDEQIAKLIADAFRVGRNEGMEVGSRDGYENGLRDGHDEGYNEGCSEGYDAGWAKGYDAGRKDAEDADDDYECKCLQCTNPREYDMGWNDGFNTDAGLDPDMKDNEAYMKGFLNGRDDREVSYNGDEESK
jgi:hypothetical protein